MAELFFMPDRIFLSMLLRALLRPPVLHSPFRKPVSEFHFTGHVATGSILQSSLPEDICLTVLKIEDVLKTCESAKRMCRKMSTTMKS